MRSTSCLGALAIVLFALRAQAAGAVDVVAQEAAQGLGQTPTSSVVVAAPIASDQPAPRGEELALRIAALVAGKLGAGAHAHPQTAQLATARAIAGRASALVYVQTEVSRGDLRTTIDVYPSMGNAWDRIRNPLPSPTGHAFSTAKIDAEVRAFLAPLVLEQASVHRARHDEGDVLAVACGDVDGDGGDEIVLVSRARVAMGRIKAGKFVVERTAPWAALAPRAAVPMREPLAGAVDRPGRRGRGNHRSRVALADGRLRRAHAALRRAGLGRRQRRVPRARGVGGRVRRGPVRLRAYRAKTSPSSRCRLRASTRSPPRASSMRRGAARAIVAVREPSGKLRIRTGDTQAAPDGTYGAQMAVLDIDQDGVPDVATSTDGTDDAVNVWTWPGAGAGASRSPAPRCAGRRARPRRMSCPRSTASRCSSRSSATRYGSFVLESAARRRRGEAATTAKKADR